MPGGTVHVVLVHREEPELCAASVAAFRNQGLPVSVTVVDNGSSAAALDTLRREAPHAEVIRAGANLGFGPGANVGLRRWLRAGAGEWVAVAPHDAIPAAGCLPAMLAEATSRPRAGLLSAEFGPGFDFLPVMDKVLGAFYRPARRGQGWEDVDYPHGTLLLARRRLLEDVGLFDERYFAYCEEVDLGVRARRRGWEVGIVWGAVVANGRLPPGPVARYLQLRNTLLLVRETHGAYFAGWRFILAAWQLAGSALRSREHCLVEAGAIADFLRGRFGPPPRWVLERAGRGT